MRKLTEDFIGVCQFCLGEYKVNGSRLMTLHGYQRPGFGHVVGKCPGAGHDPFEYDNALTKKALESMQKQVDSLANLISKIDQGKLNKVRNPNFVEEKKRDRFYDAATPEFILKGDRLFAILEKRLRANLSNEHDFISRTARYYEGLIANWKRGKIVGIDTPATGKVRELRDAFSMENEDKKAEIAAKKAERDAKPGKLMLSIFQQFSYPARGLGEDAWRAGIEKIHAAEKAFKDASKALAKSRWPGKIWVGAGYGSDVESAFRRAKRPLDTGGLTEVICIKPEWQYLDAILAAFPNAVVEDKGKEVRVFVSFEDFRA